MSLLHQHRLAELSRPELRAFALQLTRDDERARDLLQDTSYLVVKHYHSYEEGTNFRAWVKTIVRNTCLSDCRKRQRRRDIRQYITPADGWMTVTTTLNQGQYRLTTDYIHSRIASLPPLYRTTFRYYLAQLSYREIAARTGVPIGTAKSRVFTARQLLRKQLIHLDTQS
jgi:RNA polymerase sigma-70 factor (ECF subfamily)